MAKEIGDAATYVHLDVTDEASWEAAIDACGGALHVLVNNAGVLGPFTPIVKTSIDQLRQTLDINLIGTFLGLKHGGALIGRSGGGAIVNISSISGMWGTPYASSYTASKWAIRGLTKVAAMELGRMGVRVNSIHPGGVKTPMTAAVGDEGDSDWYKRLPIPRIGTVDDIAGAVLFLASDDADLHHRRRAADRRRHPRRRPHPDAAGPLKPELAVVDAAVPADNDRQFGMV